MVVAIGAEANQGNTARCNSRESFPTNAVPMGHPSAVIGEFKPCGFGGGESLRKPAYFGRWVPNVDCRHDARVVGT